MAGTGGYFLKGLGSGLQTGFNIGQQITQMKWQKEQKAKLEKEQEKIMEGVSTFNKKIEEIYADGTVSDEENMQLTTIYLASTYEVKDKIDSTYKAIQQGRKDITDQNFKWFDLYANWLDGTDPSDIPELFEFVSGNLTGEKAKETLTAYDNVLKKRYETQQKVTPDLSIAEKKYNFAINAYKKDKIDFNQLAKYMGVDVSEPELSSKEKEVELMKQYGATSEEIKNRLLGIEPISTTTPAPTSTENIREDILNADTFADANRIYKNYADKYDETALGITDLKQEWASGQINYLNKIKKSIENLLVDRGDKGQWLSNKPVTQETVGLKFKGERPASEIYEMLYKSYIEYLEKLRKLGIDVSQFPELLPLSEIEKVGGTEGFFGLGIQKGDYKSIYK